MNHYKTLNIDELEDLFSGFLINSWSYSKITAFARNEKFFEMSYIFGIYSKSSATTTAGQAYHHALQYYFTNKKEGKTLDIVELEASAFQFIDGIPANAWKIQKTTPTVDDCKVKANKTVSELLRNFFAEISVYESEIKEILGVEVYCDGFLTINGVDIPLPCHSKIDLVIKTNDNKIVIIDHKSKNTFTTEEEIAMSIGTQAITYIKSYEEKTGMPVDEVWFIENKYSKNKDGSPQLSAFKLSIDENTRRLYEALLYEPLKRMIQAVSDPDYIYLINESDNFTDMAELYDFWARTMICEVEDFNVEESKKDLVAKRLKKVRDASIQTIAPSVIKKFKENASSFIQYDLSNKNMTQEEKIEHVLRSFGTIVKVAHKLEGYSSNTFLLEVSAGVSIKSVKSRGLDIANALDVASVRISKDLVVYENKSYLSVEVSKKRDADLVFDISELKGSKIPLGKDNMGNIIYWDTSNESTPHILVCGQTGSGKSVFLESTAEYGRESGFDEINIFCRKRDFNYMHDQMQVFVYNDIADIEETMENLVLEMNSLIDQGRRKRIMIIFDEYADAIKSARSGAELDIKEMVQVGNYAPKKGIFGIIEPGAPKMQLKTVGRKKSLAENLQILLQTGRSSGFRIVCATQRASVNVIQGDAKVNFPVQVCFKVPKAVDSKVIIDEEGAENLTGKGDGLISSPEYGETIRFQAFYKPAEVRKTA